jgi:rubredoxin
MAKYVCSVCGFVYEEANGLPESDIANTGYNVPFGMNCQDDWRSARCAVRKNQNSKNRVNLLQLAR